MTAWLEIKGLKASVDDKSILNGLDMTVNEGEIHAVMGPNGAGKSTLFNVLCGNPHYRVTGGEVLFKGRNLLEMSVDERAHEGVFLAFQLPVEIPGISGMDHGHDGSESEKRRHGTCIWAGVAL